VSEVVPASKIERIVGAERHATDHIGRAVSAEQTVYILHSRECADSGIDLRDCPYSVALDEYGVWSDREDEAVVLEIVDDALEPAERGGAT
jgi:hypothetical protein